MKRFIVIGSVILFFLPVLSAQRATPLPRPRNIIIMINDGSGFNHLAAAKYFLGIDSLVLDGFSVRLALAHCPAKAGEYQAGKPGSNYLVAGYNPALAWKDTAWLKRNCTESAAAATALATGIKTYNNSIGMSLEYLPLENLVQRAKSLGKSAGVVTSVEFCHATPAGFVAHNVNRSNYAQIAEEMLFRSQCDVIMGCGDPMFDNDGVPLKGKWKNPKYVVDSAFWNDFTIGSGHRVAFTVGGRPLTVRDADGDQRADPWTVVRDIEQFRKLQHGKTPKRVLGVPNIYETLQQERTPLNGEQKNSPPITTPFVTTVPALWEMTAGALNVLDNNSKGFFLMVEGGATDWASHSNQKGRLIEEMSVFIEAVETVVKWVEKHSSWNETLLIVTSDHETGLLWGERPFVPLEKKGLQELPVMNFYSGEHTNSLVPFFAKGCGSELYRNFADEYDSIRGPYIQNSEVAQLVKLLWMK